MHGAKKVTRNEKVRNFIQEVLRSLPLYAKKGLKVPSPLTIHEANGCESCNFKGYKGRQGLFEVLSMTDELIEIILKNPAESAILKEAQKQGMLTMVQEGVLKVLNGETSMEEIARVTQEK